MLWWLRGQAGLSYPEGCWIRLPTARYPSGDRRGSVVWLREDMLDTL